MTKRMFVTVVLVSVISGGLVVVTNAFAQTNGSKSIPSVAQEIANKFHLNESDVQAIFTQHKQEMQGKMESKYETYLGNLVTSGKITEEQQQLILTKHKELMTQTQSSMKDLQTWSKQNNISLKYLRPFGPGFGRFGRFGKLHPSLTPVPTP